jgi:hypothetical protein
VAAGAEVTVGVGAAAEEPESEPELAPLNRAADHDSGIGRGVQLIGGHSLGRFGAGTFNLDVLSPTVSMCPTWNCADNVPCTWGSSEHRWPAPLSAEQ